MLLFIISDDLRDQFAGCIPELHGAHSAFHQTACHEALPAERPVHFVVEPGDALGFLAL
jgi:hypothetical protein